MKIKRNKLNSAIDKWLFEDSVPNRRNNVTDDKVAGTLGDDRDLVSMPIDPTPHVPLISRKKLPIDDDKWEPVNPEELSYAVKEMCDAVPDEKVVAAYQILKKVIEKVIERENIKVSDVVFDKDYKTEKPIKKIKKESLIREMSGDDDDDDTFIPDIDDILEFAQYHPESDLSTLPGFDEAVQKAKGEYTLEDLVNLGVYGNVKTSGHMRNKIETEIFPVLAASRNAVVLIKKLIHFVKYNQWAHDMFLETGMLSGALTNENVGELQTSIDMSQIDTKDKYGFKRFHKNIPTSSPLMSAWGFVIYEIITKPAMKYLSKYEYDRQNPNNQVSVATSDEIIKKVIDRWDTMPRKGKGTTKISIATKAWGDWANFQLKFGNVQLPADEKE